MTALFASAVDVQAWINNDKIQVNDSNSQKQNLQATRIIKGQLTSIFDPIVLASWADPSTTPELIREIAGRLTAAFLYASIYSEESGGEVSAYAQWLYNGAIADLAQIVSGNLVVADDNGNPVDPAGSGLLSFFPDNTTVPLFTVGDVFG